MVAKSKTSKPGEREEKKGRVKVGKLQVNKETVKNLTSAEQKGIKGGGTVYTRDTNCARCITDACSTN